MTPYTDGQAIPDPPEHEQLELATNGLDGNGDLLPELTPYQRGETSQLGPDDEWPEDFL